MPESLNGLTRNDWIRVGSAAIFFIASFLPYVGVSVSEGTFHISASIDAWHSYALLGLVITFAAMIVWALMRFSTVKLPTMKYAWEIVIPAAAALGLLLIIIRALTYSGTSVKIGFFLLLIAGIVFIAMTYDRNATTSTTPTV